MFSLFSKGGGPDITDMVWMSSGAMRAGMVKWAAGNSTGVIACWFRDDCAALQQAFPAESVATPVVLADSLTEEQLKGRKLLLIGHYPLAAAEAALAEKLGLKKLLIYSSLDSPLFKRFGGDKIIEVARGMGMKEEEGIEHFLVSSAIKKTQGKIGDQVSSEMLANSEEEWMRLNLGEI